MTTACKVGNGGAGSVTSNIGKSPRIFEVTRPNIEYGEFIAKFDIRVTSTTCQNIEYGDIFAKFDILVLFHHRI